MSVTTEKYIYQTLLHGHLWKIHLIPDSSRCSKDVSCLLYLSESLEINNQLDTHTHRCKQTYSKELAHMIVRAETGQQARNSSKSVYCSFEFVG